MSTPIKIFYWFIHGRATPLVLACKLGHLEYEWAHQEATEAKSRSPFGQLPYMEHGDVKLGQSMAIFRYIARMGKLEGSSPADFAKSEMLIEEAVDIYNEMSRAHYAAGDKDAAWANFVSVTVPKHTALLEKLIDGDTFVPSSGVTAGDIAIFGVFTTIKVVTPTVLDHSAKLSNFYAKFAARPEVAEFLAQPMHQYYGPKAASA